MEQLRVEAPNPELAVSLVDELKDFHAELLSGEGGRCEVHIELGNTRESQIGAALTAVERWLAHSGINAAKVMLVDRTYILEA